MRNSLTLVSSLSPKPLNRFCNRNHPESPYNRNHSIVNSGLLFRNSGYANVKAYLERRRARPSVAPALATEVPLFHPELAQRSAA
jgi:hypothetical protein